MKAYRVIGYGAYFAMFLYLQSLGGSAIANMFISMGAAVLAGGIAMVVTRKKP